MSKRRHWLVVDGKGVVRYKYTYFFIKTMKNVNFGGEKTPGGNAKASPLAWGEGGIEPGCQVVKSMCLTTRPRRPWLVVSP